MAKKNLLQFVMGLNNILPGLSALTLKERVHNYSIDSEMFNASC